MTNTTKHDNYEEDWNAEYWDPSEPDAHYDQYGDRYTTFIPGWLTDTFEPCRPVTNNQTLAFATRGKEPYPGYEFEMTCWDQEWQKANDWQNYEDEGSKGEKPEPLHPLEWYVALIREYYLEEVDAVHRDMSKRAGDVDLTDEEYTKLFNAVAAERENVRLGDDEAQHLVFPDPWLYRSLVRSGYLLDLDDDFRFAWRTVKDGLVSSDGPYREVIREVHEMRAPFVSKD